MPWPSRPLANTRLAGMFHTDWCDALRTRAGHRDGLQIPAAALVQLRLPWGRGGVPIPTWSRKRTSDTTPHSPTIPPGAASCYGASARQGVRRSPTPSRGRWPQWQPPAGQAAQGPASRLCDSLNFRRASPLHCGPPVTWRYVYGAPSTCWTEVALPPDWNGVPVVMPRRRRQ